MEARTHADGDPRHTTIFESLWRCQIQTPIPRFRIFCKGHGSMLPPLREEHPRSFGMLPKPRERDLFRVLLHTVRLAIIQRSGNVSITIRTPPVWQDRLAYRVRAARTKVRVATINLLHILPSFSSSFSPPPPPYPPSSPLNQ